MKPAQDKEGIKQNEWDPEFIGDGVECMYVRVWMKNREREREREIEVMESS